MKRAALLIGLLLVCPLTWADVTVIYRKADRAVVGIASPPHSAEIEIANITNSELGGTRADYATISIPDDDWRKKGDRDVTVNGTGRVVFVSNATQEAKKNAKNSARSKLKALGLTEEELNAILTP